MSYDSNYDLTTAIRPADIPAMEPEVKERWLAALRDGRPQTTGVLHRLESSDETRPAGQCCLGVLTEIAKDEGIVVERPSDWPSRVAYGTPGGYGEAMILPEPVKTWAGLSDSNPDVLIRRTDVGTVQKTCLAELNDAGVTFPEIADIIEKAF